MIQVPDFGPAPPTDGSMAVKMDGPSGDLGAPKFSPYGTAPAAATLRAAWVADPGVSEAFAVGHGGVILHRVGDGMWTAEPSGTDADLYALAARGPGEVYAVGKNGVILRRSGGAWQAEGRELHLTSSLFGVTALASGEVVAVGDLGVVARRQSAGVWVQESGPGLGSASLRAVWGGALEGMYAVGMGATILRRTGGAWQADTMALDPSGRGNYYAVTGSGAGDVHIAGEYGLVLHRSPDGASWIVDKLTPPQGMASPLHLFSLYAVGGDLFAAGAGGVVEHLAGGSWTVEPTGTANDLYGLAGAGPRSILAVGGHGVVMRRL